MRPFWLSAGYLLPLSLHSAVLNQDCLALKMVWVTFHPAPLKRVVFFILFFIFKCVCGVYTCVYRCVHPRVQLQRSDPLLYHAQPKSLNLESLTALGARPESWPWPSSCLCSALQWGLHVCAAMPSFLFV